MSTADAKKTIRTVIAAIQAAHTAYTLAVELDNREQVDQSTQVKPYLQVEIDFIGGEQKDMANRPIVEQRGQLLLCVVTKGGNGTAEADALVDFVSPYFDLKVLAGDVVTVHFHAAEVYRGHEKNGWWYQPLLVNFWYDRLSA